jgi:hypothetical protein
LFSISLPWAEDLPRYGAEKTGNLVDCGAQIPPAQEFSPLTGMTLSRRENLTATEFHNPPIFHKIPSRSRAAQGLLNLNANGRTPMT